MNRLSTGHGISYRSAVWGCSPKSAGSTPGTCDPLSINIGSAAEIQPDLLVDFTVFGPVLFHLHMEEQVHLAAEQFVQFGTGRFADRLDLAAALAEHDRPLGLASDDDLLVDFDAAVLAFDVLF